MSYIEKRKIDKTPLSFLVKKSENRLWDQKATFKVCSLPQDAHKTVIKLTKNRYEQSDFHNSNI